MATTQTSTAGRAFNRRQAGQTGILIGIAAVVSIITLSLLYSGLPFFGPVNDLTNAVAGVLYFALAFQVDALVRQQSGGKANFLLAMAGIAMLFTTINSVLVAIGQLFWTTGGMYTAIGLGFLGIWLTGVLRTGVLESFMTIRTNRLGTVAGYAMLVGFVAGPAFTGWTVTNSLIYISYIGAGAGWLMPSTST